MRIIIRKVLVLICIFVVSSTAYSEQINTASHLGFTFGMNSKSAKNLINNHGNKIIKNDIDSKKVRTILFEGIIVEYPAINETDKNTRLEFYDDKLMSTLLRVKNLDGSQFIGVQDHILKSIVTDYGEPSSRDNMFSYDIWTWKTDDLKLILSSSRNKGEVKLEYTYIPVAYTKSESEMEVKRKGEKRHPVDQMFKDGNFSQQGGPEIQRQRP